MDGGIYFMDDDHLIEMTEKSYDREAALQNNLAEFPKLLAGDQINEASPRQWALIANEAAVPDKEGGSDRWSADHLFVDQDGTPTIVEVKRSEDTRIRREVVGQMLDYVAHAKLYWDADLLESRFVATCEDVGRSPEEVLTRLTDDTPAEFWTSVETNLRSGSVRLLFVADEIPSELRHVVEFLNEQMRAAEVLAVEVRQFTSENKRAFVPQLYGQTEEARSTTSTTRPEWGDDELLEHITANVNDGTLTEDEAAAIEDLYEFIQEEADSYDFGGSANVTVTGRWRVLGGSEGVFTVNSAGNVVFWQPGHNLYEHDDTAAWDEAELEQWYDDIAAIDHPDVSRAEIEEQQKLPMRVFTEAQHRTQFKESVRRFTQACREAKRNTND